MKIAPIIANCLAIVVLSKRFDLDEEPLKLPVELEGIDSDVRVIDFWNDSGFSIREY